MANKKNFAEAIRLIVDADKELSEAFESEAFNADIAEKIYEARKAAGLTQEELASLASTSQSVIARLEDADYSGHSLRMLRRIAEALGKQLRVEFRDPNGDNSGPSVTFTIERVEWLANRCSSDVT